MKNIHIATILGIMLPMHSAIAAEEVKSLQPLCGTKTRSFMTQCSFEDLAVAYPLTFLDDTISTEHSITYSFGCVPGLISLSLGSESVWKPLDSGMVNTIQTVVSSQPIKVSDHNAGSHFQKFLKPSCNLKIHSMSKYPSSTAIRGFAKEASWLTELLGKDMNLSQLSEALKELSSLSQNQYKRVQKMVWDFLDFAIEDAGFDKGIAYFSDKEFEILSTEEMEARGTLDDWEDLTFDYPSIGDLVSILNYASQNLNTSTPVPSPLDTDVLITGYEELSQACKEMNIFRASTNSAKTPSLMLC